ncbi:hypothetical protein HZY97_16155 [Sphingomonas sp. R-74633]|uniref:hypothetical protein n=1 Tax=Sphingomonas sp. R-74633 TaxID=2751188 RepID=UPI0015D0E3FB|nr:hypothetical protein [Sphingomonas sp. R-74633]NYT42306.1 hypothetical protein [Sphingomonas sp. R-74633]
MTGEPLKDINDLAQAQGLDAVRNALDNITDDIDAPPPDYDSDRGEEEDYVGGAGWAGSREARPPRYMPDDCPVIPLGTMDGIFYFLTALGELRGLPADKVANKHIVAMFAPDSLYLEDQWPRKRLIAQTDDAGVAVKDKDGNTLKEWVTIGWNTEIVTTLLMDCCARKGVWDAREKVRGRGAWRADDGSLVLHCGNTILTNGRWLAPGEHGKMVYPAQAPIPKPFEAGHSTAEQLMPRLVATYRARGMKITGVGGREIPLGGVTPARFLFEILKTWNWDRSLIDPMLLLGWIMLAPFGGALDYRPILWPTGGRGTGKSELLELIAALFQNALLVSPKASEAGVRQVMGQQSLPVNLDESEAGKDNSKMSALIELARLAATSQGNIIKGGQNHQASEFRATSCFLFTSILVPPLEPADKSRMGILELNRLPAGARSVGFKNYVDEIGRLGAWMRKRFCDNWGRWDELYGVWSEALMDIGEQGSRAADQFGSLRAAAELALFDGMPEAEDVAMWAEMLSLRNLAETSDAPEEGEICLGKIRSKPVQLDFRRGQRLVSEWLVDHMKPIGKDQYGAEDQEDKQRRETAEVALGRIGLKVVRYGPNDRGKNKPPPEIFGEWLAVASSHDGLEQLLQGTKFGEGVWSQALARLPGAIKASVNKRNIRFNGHQSKCTLIPLAVALPPGDEDDEEDAGAVPERARA